MKYFILRRLMMVFVAAIGFFSCKEKTSKKQFEVTGTINNSGARMIYLEELPAVTMQRIVVDSATIGKNGSFLLKASTGNESIFNLRLDNNDYPVVSVINDAAAVKVNVDLNNKTEPYTVEGSEASQKIKEIITTGTKKWNNLFRLGQEIDSLQKTNAGDSLLNLVNNEGETAVADIKMYVKTFLKDSRSPAFILFALGRFGNFFSMDEYAAELEAAQKKFPGNEGIISAKKMFDQQVAAAKQKEASAPATWIGKEAPEIILPDTRGQEVKLSSFKGKYVLVDFWASWCSPCRYENPNVVKAYNKFKDKNFTILGVSMDKPGEKDKWLQAIKEDNLVWTQVSELKWWDSRVVSLYNIEGIPYNVLINPEGKVIAEGLRGPALEAKLEEVLK